jgi:hypothetical protein
MRTLGGTAVFILAIALFAQDTVYVCPMDPEIRSSRPGICSRCGMKLLNRVPDPIEYAIDLNISARAPRPGATAQLKFTVRNPWNGAPVTKFQTVHERLFHLFVVGQNLEFFAHDHPAAGRGGEFHLGFAFPNAGLYRVLGDFYPDGGTPQLIARSVLLPGTPPPAPVLTRDYSAKDASNLRIELDTTPQRPVAGTKTMLFFRVAPAEGLEPYLGTWGHMLAASDDLIDMIHEHALYADGGPQIQFNVIFPRAHVYRLWVQFQRKGVVNTAHFDVAVSALQ